MQRLLDIKAPDLIIYNEAVLIMKSATDMKAANEMRSVWQANVPDHLP